MDDLKEMTVLCVEDDEKTREALCRFLNRRVGRLISAGSGEEGVEKYITVSPDILIADLLMPGMNGWEMIERIRGRDPHCGIVVTSTVSEVSGVLEAVNLGIDAYVVKPVNVAELLAKLERIAGEINERRRNERPMSIDFSIEEKGAVEEGIRKEFLKLLKDSSGKGAKNAAVTMRGNKLTIVAYNALTTMESTMLESRKNLPMVEEHRRLFYEAIRSRIEEMTSRMVGRKMTLLLVETDGSKGTDRLLLTGEQR